MQDGRATRPGYGRNGGSQRGRADEHRGDACRPPMAAGNMALILASRGAAACTRCAGRMCVEQAVRVPISRVLAYCGRARSPGADHGAVGTPGAPGC